MKKLALRVVTQVAAFALAGSSSAVGAETPRFRLITLDPGHFHAALVQKFMYADIGPEVHVYAPAGDDVQEHLKRIEGFNTRASEPTRWIQRVYTGPDFLERMIAEKPGNVVVLSGNNARKTDYISKSIDAGLHVLADKPMAITPADFERLKDAFAQAERKGVLLYDIMTERFEISTMLQRELSQDAELFGELQQGSVDEPAITKESVHHFSKIVAGAPLKRPQWFFDVRQEGEGIVDVATHLVDLIQWEVFPEQILEPSDVEVLQARRWPTVVTPAQFRQVTGAGKFPQFLHKDLKNGDLSVSSNGEFTYRLKDVHARVSVIWNFEAPAGAGDTHYSIMRGTRANLVIRQGAEQKYKPVLYVEKAAAESADKHEAALRAAITKVQTTHPGLDIRRDGEGWKVVVPPQYDVGHEAHFAQVTENFLRYLRAGQVPDWEVPNTITKYHTIMQAYELSR